MLGAATLCVFVLSPRPVVVVIVLLSASVLDIAVEELEEVEETIHVGILDAESAEF